MSINLSAYEMTASTTYAAPSVVISRGANAIGSTAIVVEDVISIFYHGAAIDRQQRWDLRRLLENVAAYLPAGNLDGDIADPKPKQYGYSQDILKLAKTHKRQEIEMSEELLFGIELEFNHSAHSLKDLSPLLGMGIFKHDSSVDGEYVTLPYTYSDMVSKITSLSDSFDKLLSANDTLTPLSGVGMHIHLSRKGLSVMQLCFLQELFGGEMTPYISWLCERYPNQYCRYHNFCGDRYVALNEANKDTVEIRAFLSPVNAANIIRNLTLVKAWLDYAAAGDLDSNNGEPAFDWDITYPEFAFDKDKVDAWWEGHPTQKRAARMADIGDYEEFDEPFDFNYDEQYESALGGSMGDFDGDGVDIDIMDDDTINDLTTELEARAAAGDPTAGWEVFHV